MNERNLKAIINAIPGNVFFKDTQCRYVYASHLCSMLNTAGRNDFTIIGKTDLEVQVQKELGEKFYNEDCQLLKSGGEMEYVSEMKFGDATYYYKIQKKTVHVESGEIIGIVGVVTDITQETVLQQELEYISTTDVLTGLNNRASLKRWLESPTPEASFPLSIVSADFDNLKVLNDTHGHYAGDTYLITGAKIMKDTLPEHAKIYRTGGDEFFIVIPKCTEEECNSYISQISKAFQERDIEGVQMSISLGAVTLTDSNQNITEAFYAADDRMYEQKRKHHAVQSL